MIKLALSPYRNVEKTIEKKPRRGSFRVVQIGDMYYIQQYRYFLWCSWFAYWQNIIPYDLEIKAIEEYERQIDRRNQKRFHKETVIVSED